MDESFAKRMRRKRAGLNQRLVSPPLQGGVAEGRGGSPAESLPPTQPPLDPLLAKEGKGLVAAAVYDLFNVPKELRS